MRLSVKNLQDYLVQFAYGKEMQKLKAFEDWSKAAANLDAKPRFCDMCDVPALSGLKECPARHCGLQYCDRDYCNESVVHNCPETDKITTFCNKNCNVCEDCETVICPGCSEECFICKENLCKDHYVTLNDEIICNRCVEDASNKLKKRKIDGDK